MRDSLWKEVVAAQERLAGVAHKTPIFTCSELDRIAASTVFLKAESFQRTGSFKFRGAYNAVACLSESERACGVITHSSGNHGQAVALAARILDVPAIVVMPEDAPTVKRVSAEGYGATVFTCDGTQEAREKTTRMLVARTGAIFIDSHDDKRVIAGQGTAAAELIAEIHQLDVLLAPVGGGGLISGTAIAAKHLLPSVRVIGCEPAGADDAFRSLARGERILDFVPDTIADGLRTPLGANTFELIRQMVDDIVVVPERDIADAMRFVWERMKLVIEPSSAVAVAPLLTGEFCKGGERIGVILSGGNVDLESFFSALSRDDRVPPVS